MPTYEYKCGNCGHRFEKFQKMTDTPLEYCPECKGPVNRVIGTGAGVIFKGNGYNYNEYQHHTRCGSERTCCGRNTPCDTPPCEK